MMKTWFLYPTVCASMDFQMALDELLFRRTESLGNEVQAGQKFPLLRFYYSAGDWVTIGYSVRDFCSDDIRQLSGKDTGIAKGKKIPLSRRITGGGCVLHGKDLVFSLIARKKDDESFRSVRTSYRKIHEAVKEGFKRFGKQLRFCETGECLARGWDCFKFSIVTDLAEGNRKVAGGAQKRSSGVLLHQESIQLDGRWTGEDLLPQICEGFQTIFGVQIQPNFSDPEILKEAEEIMAKNRVELHERP